MKQSLVILISFFCLFAGDVKGQVSLTYCPGYGVYMMSDLRQYQEYVLEQSGLPAKAVEKFPPYLTHRIYAGFGNKRMRHIGFYAGFLTTGGRISLSDYSGKWLSDMVVDGIQAGGHYERRAAKTGPLELNFYIDAGTTVSLLKLDSYLEVAGEKYTESYLFVAHSLDLQPGIKLTCSPGRISMGAYAGVEGSFETPFYEKGNPKMKLGIDASRLAKPGWAGLRAGLLVSLQLGRIEKTEK
jgi:hypothetical protein